MIQPTWCYIGKDSARAESLSALTEGAFCVYPDAPAAVKAGLKGAVAILWEKDEVLFDVLGMNRLRKKYGAMPVILLAESLSDEERSAYLAAGVNAALPPDTEAEVLHNTIRLFAETRQTDKKRAHNASHPDSRFRIPPGKRLFDIAASSAALLALSPLLLATAAAIRLESKGPIIYRSKRVGSNYQIFDFLKFRSMYTAADLALKDLSKLNQYAAEQTPEQEAGIHSAHVGGAMLISDDCIIPEESYLSQVTTENENAFVKFENDPRITRVGRFIRKYSIDELPQLLNILRGDMSVVGNRPLPLYEAERLTSDEYIDRFMCPAGLTGLWQVEKRGEAGKLSAEERKQLDIQYAKNYSASLDLKIIMKTFLAFVQKENV